MKIDLKDLQEKIRVLLKTEIKEIIINVRNHNFDFVEEKFDGDSATVADIKISNLLNEKLSRLLPDSLVIEEESFNKTVFEQIKKYKYIWVVDPIDGTKAFRTPGNNEYCCAIALLDKGKPLLSSVYAPELEWGKEKGCLFEARADEVGAFLNGKGIYCNKEIDFMQITCINHVHRDTELNEREERIANLCGKIEKIRAYEGHSTLVQYCMVILNNGGQIFTRREANIWDVIQGAYIVEKAGGVVMYENGQSILPIDFNLLESKEKGNKLLVPFNIACSKHYFHVLVVS